MGLRPWCSVGVPHAVASTLELSRGKRLGLRLPQESPRSLSLKPCVSASSPIEWSTESFTGKSLDSREFLSCNELGLAGREIDDPVPDESPTNPPGACDDEVPALQVEPVRSRIIELV